MKHFTRRPSRISESIESATSVDDKKIDRRLSSTSKRYRGYRISLDARHERYNIYDAHGKLEDQGFKSVDDAMAHIDELVSIESATNNVYSSKQLGVRRRSRHCPVTSAEKRTDDSIRKAYKAVKATTYPQGTYWMAKYKDINGNLHKIVFQFDSKDFDEAKEEMDAVIAEPYTAGRLLGRCNPELAEKDGFVVLSSQDIHCAEEIEDYEDDIQEISQEFTSENTSINSSKLPAIFKMVTFQPGTINIDYGGGRFNNVADYLTQFDVINLVYDPYNRTPEHNKEVIRTVRKAGGADTATCSNVLNVIKEPEVRQNVLQNIKKLVKPNGTVYITVYEGSGKNNEGPTKSGYQLNRKTEGYLDEIKQVFPDAVRKGKLIIAHPNRSAVTGSSYKYVGEPDSYDPATGRSYYESPVDWDDKLEQIREMVASDDRLRLKGSSPWGCNIVNINTKQTFAFDFWEDTEPFADQLSKFQEWLGNASSVTSAEDLSYDALTCEDCTYDLWTLVQDDSGKWVREDKIDTYDDYDTAEAEAEALAKDTPCQLVEVGPNGPALVWTSKTSDPAIIEWLHDEYTMGNTKYSELVADLVDNFSVSTDEADQIISDWMDEDEDVHLEYDEDIDGNTDVVEVASGRKHSIKTLHDALLNKASRVMRNMGFPLNEVADYLVVDIQPEEDGWLNCEVRAELSYEGMSEMIDALNPIVQKYDKEAYFDHVTGGIISAYLPSGKFNAIQSSTATNSSKVFELIRYTPDSGENGPSGDEFDVVDWDQFESEEAAKAHWNAEIQDGTCFVREGDPSDYIEEATVLGAWSVDDYPEPSYSSEPQERTTKQEIIINIDDDILVDASTDDVDFIGNPSFLDDDETWVAEDEAMFKIAEPDEVYEHVMDLIIDRIPMSTGKYHVRGSVKLVYDLTLLYIDDSTGPDDQHSELDVDASESRYDPYTSEVIELDVTQQ